MEIKSLVFKSSTGMRQGQSGTAAEISPEYRSRLTGQISTELGHMLFRGSPRGVAPTGKGSVVLLSTCKTGVSASPSERNLKTK